MTVDEDWGELRQGKTRKKAAGRKAGELTEAWQTAKGMGYTAYVLGDDIEGYHGKTIHEVKVLDCNVADHVSTLRFKVEYRRTIWVWPGLKVGGYWKPQRKARWSVLRADLYETREAALRSAKTIRRDRTKILDMKLEELHSSLAWLQSQRKKLKKMREERVNWSKGWTP